MVCDPKEIILSGGSGYRLLQILSVHRTDPPNFVKSNNITQTGEKEIAPDVGGSVGGNVGRDVPNDGDDVGNELTAREAWILRFKRRAVTPTNIKLRPFGDFVKRLFLYQLNRDTAPMGRVIEEHSCAAAGIA